MVGPTLILDIIPTSSPAVNSVYEIWLLYCSLRLSKSIFFISSSTARPSWSTLYLVVIFNWFEAPKVLTSALPNALFNVDSISEDLTSLSNLTIYDLPPKKSTPWFRPWNKRELILIKIKVADITYVALLLPRNLIFKLLNKSFVDFVEKDNFPDLNTLLSINNLVMKIAVNNEVAIPISNVVAKPLIGPVPKIYNTRAVSPVVIFASNIEDKALLNPSFIDCFRPFSFLNSSLTLSNMSTFASTDIPIVKTIPAIPGSVNTAPSPAKIPNIKTIFSINATSANIPEGP